MDYQEHRAHRGQAVRVVLRAIKEIVELVVHRGQMVHRAQAERRVQVEQRGQAERRVHRELRALVVR